MAVYRPTSRFSQVAFEQRVSAAGAAVGEVLRQFVIGGYNDLFGIIPFGQLLASGSREDQLLVCVHSVRHCLIGLGSCTSRQGAGRVSAEPRAEVSGPTMRERPARSDPHSRIFGTCILQVDV